MIKKIVIISSYLHIFNFKYSHFLNHLHLGTGSLVPSNIMIMLDNSGSMGWDLNGYQLEYCNSDFLNNPTEM